MDVTVSALGAITALVIAILLILKKVQPAYGMVAGALIISACRRCHDPCGSYRTGSFAARKIFPRNCGKCQYGY